MHVGYDSDAIRDAVARADRARPLRRRRRSTTGPDASQAIVDVLAGGELYTQKRFCDNRERET